MIKTENLTLDGAWQEITKEIETKAMILSLNNDVRSFEISSDSAGVNPITIRAVSTLTIDKEEKNLSSFYYVRGTNLDVLQILKQR